MKRIDELKVLGSYQWLDLGTAFASLSVHAGPGLLLYGDFGSLAIQENAHKTNNAHPRPVPETYDASHQGALGYLYTELFFPKLSTNFHLYSHITHRADFNVDLTGSYWVVKPLLQSSFALSYKWNKVDHCGITAQNCYGRENGFWLSNKTLIGPLVIERGFNFNNLNQYSYIGFRFTDFRSNENTAPGRNFSYSIGWPIGHNSWVEFFRLYPFPDVQRIGLFLRTYHTENTFDNNLTNEDDDRHLRRTKETSIGVEATFSDPRSWSLIDGFAFCGGGFTRDMVTTYDQYEARFLALKTSPMVHAGCGLRLAIPDFIFHVYSRCLGAELRANVRYNFKGTGIFSNPDLLLSWGLFFSER